MVRVRRIVVVVVVRIGYSLENNRTPTATTTASIG